VGAALLVRHDPAASERVLFLSPEEHNRVTVELENFELTHPEVGGAVLEASHFPPGFVRAVVEHHLPFDELETVLGRIIVAGEAVADCMSGEGDPLAAAQLLEVMDVRADLDGIVDETQASVEQLSGFLAEG
jgi:HD-like signal output (HDOD) protein